mgnify:FL=1
MTVLPNGHLGNLYFGKRIHDREDFSYLLEMKQRAMTACVYEGNRKFSLEHLKLEYPVYGSSDYRYPAVEILQENGSRISEFTYVSHTVTDGKPKLSGLPATYTENDEEAQTLCVKLKDEVTGIVLELLYTIFAQGGIITRSARFTNEGTSLVHLLNAMSLSLDLPDKDYVWMQFSGAWSRERHVKERRLEQGIQSVGSIRGNSSHEHNPFIVLRRPSATENAGEVMGFSLIYSGNHRMQAEVDTHDTTRITVGINPQNFCWQLPAGESFEAPEAVMAYSKAGYNGMSQCMHRFVREHIVRGAWKKKVRPVLLNSWEAAYFDINEKKLLQLAKAGKEAGIELFVMDDGWFGHRDNDRSSLGDWKVNTKKLPNGLAGLCKKINDLGMDFGIWVEPEMVNVDSELYKAHPDWAMDIPGKNHSEGRNQRLLDLSRAEVQDHIIGQMSDLFSSANIAYVKWDMNRIVTDYYSKILPPERQGEVAHRYVLGLYRCMKELTERFPEILFEGCAAGGNRFDLGILSYFPQIWASDDTDALCRAEIQTGYSYGYPMSVVSAHVSSCPNHQTLRMTPLETRFQVAAFGICGYECNFCDMKKEDFDAVKAQIALYKEWRKVLQTGSFYRGRNFSDQGSTGSLSGPLTGNIQEWTCVSEDREKAVGFLMQKLVSPNTQFEYYRPNGLNPEARYHFYNRSLKYNVKEFGDLVNTVAPVHIRQDSVAHNLIAKFVKMDGEAEDFCAYGDALMYAGVKLKQAFGGTGYNEQIRHFPDFASRMYFMEQMND